jgi:hypothetical protein
VSYPILKQASLWCTYSQGGNGSKFTAIIEEMPTRVGASSASPFSDADEMANSIHDDNDTVAEEAQSMVLLL